MRLLQKAGDLQSRAEPSQMRKAALRCKENLGAGLGGTPSGGFKRPGVAVQLCVNLSALESRGAQLAGAAPPIPRAGRFPVAKRLPPPTFACWAGLGSLPSCPPSGHHPGGDSSPTARGKAEDLRPPERIEPVLCCAFVSHQRSWIERGRPAKPVCPQTTGGLGWDGGGGGILEGTSKSTDGFSLHTTLIGKGGNTPNLNLPQNQASRVQN